jgi:hypothetical protein
MLIFLATSACSKEEQEIKIDNTSTKSEIEILLDKTLLPMEVKDNTLVFSSEENYQKAIDFLALVGDNNFDAFEKYYGFSSLRQTSYYKEIEENMDGLFATLLNRVAEIIIGAEKFSFDFASETVSVNVIMNDNNSKGSKTVYDFEDDYFSIQEGTSTESKTTYCNANDVYFDYNTDFLGDPTMRYRVRYYNFLIYHTLSAQFECVSGIPQGDPYHEFSLMTQDFCYVTNVGQYTNHDISLNSPMISYNLTSGITYRPYQNSRRLTAYKLKVNFYLPDELFSDQLYIFCL